MEIGRDREAPQDIVDTFSKLGTFARYALELPALRRFAGARRFGAYEHATPTARKVKSFDMVSDNLYQKSGVKQDLFIPTTSAGRASRRAFAIDKFRFIDDKYRVLIRCCGTSGFTVIVAVRRSLGHLYHHSLPRLIFFAHCY
ncbi:hypothetical protein [Mycobacterium simulans]|uniref:hypothetical protein n=1 Tax=Mycobacterium simulans TaxID=627089 RepID=UPI001640B5B3|nr:hypothetical protein [Mycobacterium simulans]